MRALLTALVAASSISACLADLPPPAQCPPAGKQPSIACEQQLSNSPAGLCVPQNDHSVDPCCACRADACPASASACFPDGDCPRAVTDRTRAATTCHRLAPETFQGCVCGCGACMSVCDGTGPIVATHVPNGQVIPALPLELPQPIATSGRIGAYVRLRGRGGLGLQVQGGVSSGAASPVASTSDTEFTDAVVWEPQAWPAWKTAADAPTSLLFVATEGVTTLEIDCIVPFVTAP